MSNTPKLRTAPQALEEIKRDDPNTALTIRALRRMVNSGEIPSISVGNKKLIDFEVLKQHLMCYNKPQSNLCHLEND